MTEEDPIDLRGLQPEDPPDQASLAIRRFRWRVVLVTVVALILVAGGAAWAASWALGERSQLQMLRDWASGPVSQTAIGGASNCRTPSYKVGYADVTVLEVTSLESGSVVYHLIIDGNGHPLATRRKGAALSFTDKMKLSATAGTARTEEFIAKPGWSVGEAYVVVPRGEEQVRLELVDPNGTKVGTLPLDQAVLSNC